MKHEKINVNIYLNASLCQSNFHCQFLSVEDEEKIFNYISSQPSLSCKLVQKN